MNHGAKRLKFRLTNPWESGYPRPWRHLPFWEWTLCREGWRIWFSTTRPVNDAEFRQVIADWAARPPEHPRCKCSMAIGEL